MRDKRVVYIQYTNPAGYPPLEHSSRILADQGWDILFLGAGAWGAGSLRFPPHARIKVKTLGDARIGWRQKLHYFAFMIWAVVWCARSAPRWVYLSDPLACPIGVLLSIFIPHRLIYHEHDTPPARETSRAGKFVAWARRRLVRGAKLLILPNAARARRVVAECGRGGKTYVVWNVPRADEVADSLPRADGTLLLYYHGSLNPSRLPPTLLQALAKVPAAIELLIVGYETVGHAGYVEQWLGEARARGVAHRIRYLGPLDRAEMMAVARSACIGLSLLPRDHPDVNMANMAGASNKVFDYMACGLAVLVTDDPEWERLFVASRFGLSADPASADALARVMRWAVEHRNEVRALGDAGRAKIRDEWNYETAFAPVLKEMNEVVA